ncbi:unnamed protein product [Bursaphelenchus xylophilus]|uniref:(pine wood nematode) hypothetical protein n=1 Tax=Bursaphelenchus xylophilus TaxID=6326 RepID=A0A1I7S9A5_BURXY|nr:unnamed protein product [Bursaphelenchus xylophilus]CAG9100479.1 unnamed protein product [Bursaphelenchus xylophilus]
MFLRVSFIIISIGLFAHYTFSCGCCGGGGGCCDCCSSSIPTMATTQATPMTTTSETLNINVSRRRRAYEDSDVKLTYLPRVQREEFLKDEGPTGSECNCTCDDEWNTTELPTTTLGPENSDASLNLWSQISDVMDNTTVIDSL